MSAEVRAKSIVILACSTLVLVLCLLLIKGNVPVLDDYNSVLGMFTENGLVDYRGIPRAHNQHLILFTRLTALLDYSIFRDMNFTRLSIYAALGLLPIALGVQIIVRKFGLDELSSALIAVLVFRPEHWKHLLYPMANIAGIWVMAFGVWAILFAARGRHVMSLLLVLLAIATHSSGLIVPISIALMIAVQRRYLVAAGYAAAAILLFLGYQQLGGGGGGLLTSFLNAPLEAITFALGVLGSSFSSLLLHSANGMILVGFAVLAVLLVILWSSRESAGPEFGLVLFCLGGIALIGVGRGQMYADSFVDMAADGRYRIYSIVATALAVAYLLRGRKWPVVGVVVAALVGFSFAKNIPEWRMMNILTTRPVVQFLKTGDASLLPTGRNAPDNLTNAVKNGIYAPPGN